MKMYFVSRRTHEDVLPIAAGPQELMMQVFNEERKRKGSETVEITSTSPVILQLKRAYSVCSIGRASWGAPARGAA